MIFAHSLRTFAHFLRTLFYTVCFERNALLYWVFRVLGAINNGAKSVPENVIWLYQDEGRRRWSFIVCFGWRAEHREQRAGSFLSLEYVGTLRKQVRYEKDIFKNHET